jgi:hypothetical protein
MSTNPSVEELREKFLTWNQLRAQEKGLRPNTLNAFEIANPSGMSVFGIYRYWHKVRNKNNDIGTTNPNSR